MSDLPEERHTATWFSVPVPTPVCAPPGLPGADDMKSQNKLGTVFGVELGLHKSGGVAKNVATPPGNSSTRCAIGYFALSSSMSS